MSFNEKLQAIGSAQNFNSAAGIVRTALDKADGGVIRAIIEVIAPMTLQYYGRENFEAKVRESAIHLYRAFEDDQAEKGIEELESTHNVCVIQGLKNIDREALGMRPVSLAQVDGMTLVRQDGVQMLGGSSEAPLLRTSSRFARFKQWLTKDCWVARHKMLTAKMFLAAIAIAGLVCLAVFVPGAAVIMGYVAAGLAGVGVIGLGIKKGYLKKGCGKVVKFFSECHISPQAKKRWKMVGKVALAAIAIAAVVCTAVFVPGAAVIMGYVAAGIVGVAVTGYLGYKGCQRHKAAVIHQASGLEGADGTYPTAKRLLNQDKKDKAIAAEQKAREDAAARQKALDDAAALNVFRAISGFFAKREAEDKEFQPLLQGIRSLLDSHDSEKVRALLNSEAVKPLVDRIMPPSHNRRGALAGMCPVGQPAAEHSSADAGPSASSSRVSAWWNGQHFWNRRSLATAAAGLSGHDGEKTSLLSDQDNT
jgi:hypothetical protein